MNMDVSPGVQPAPADTEVNDLLNQLASIMRSGLGMRSKWALNTAAEAAQTEGIGGMIVIKIPPKTKDYVDVTFTCGLVEMVSRWTTGP